MYQFLVKETMLQHRENCFRIYRPDSICVPLRHFVFVQAENRQRPCIQYSFSLLLDEKISAKEHPFVGGDAWCVLRI